MDALDRLLATFKGLFAIPMTIVLSLFIIVLLINSYRNKSNDWQYIPVLLFIAFVFFFTEQVMTAVGWIVKPILDAIVWITALLSDGLK